MMVVYLGWRLVDIYLGTGHNAKPASREIRYIYFTRTIVIKGEVFN